MTYAQNDVLNAMGRTTSGEFRLRLYDWLCAFEDNGNAFSCRQRDFDANIRFVFQRTPERMPTHR